MLYSGIINLLFLYVDFLLICLLQIYYTCHSSSQSSYLIFFPYLQHPLGTKPLATLCSDTFKSHKLDLATVSQLIFSFQLKVIVCLRRARVTARSILTLCK